jgi:methyl coenzyme M reductase subunit C
MMKPAIMMPSPVETQPRVDMLINIDGISAHVGHGGGVGQTGQVGQGGGAGQTGHVGHGGGAGHVGHAGCEIMYALSRLKSHMLGSVAILHCNLPTVGPGGHCHFQ